MKRSFLADAQVLQTGARRRGMGHYARELLAALDARDDVSVEVVFSRHLASDEARADLAARAPGIRVTQADLRLDRPDDRNVLRHNAAVLDRLLADRPPATEFLLLSAMQATIRPALPATAPNPSWALVYDLLPWLRPEVLLPAPRQRREYADRLRELLRADGFLAISTSVALDLTRLLGLDPDRITTIDGAPIPHGESADVPPAGVSEPFVLLPTGNDPRKNNERAVRAFAAFNADGAHQLVVTSDFRTEEQTALAALTPQVHFTGSVPGPQLGWLYAHAAAVLFPPEAEGLGLPVLEALAAGAPVACSDIDVFTEISRTAFQLFDPRSPQQMADALRRAVTAGPAPDREAILSRYSWPEVARRMVEGTALPRARPERRVRLRLVGPAEDPAGAVMVRLYAELSRRADVGYRLAPPAADARSDFLPILRDSGRLDVFVVSGVASSATALFLALGSAGVVYLLDTDLTVAWTAMVEAGLVSPSRRAAEDRLTGCEVEGSAHTVALVAAARMMLVPTVQDRDRLIEVARRAGLQARIEVLPWPDGPDPDQHPAAVAGRLVALAAGLEQ